MVQVKAGSTDPELFKRVAALWDNPAWGEFFEQLRSARHETGVRLTAWIPSRSMSFASACGSSWRGGCRPISTTPAVRFAAG